MPRESVFDFTDLDEAEPLPRQLSPQQETVLGWTRDGKGNATVIAVAGSGKTTTLIEAVGEMTGRVAFGAFNKNIADEIESRVVLLPSLRAQANVGTFHRFGFRTLRNYQSGATLDQYKLRNLMRDHGRRRPVLESFAIKLTSLAKLTGIGALADNLEDKDAWYAIVDHHALDAELAGSPGAWRSASEIDSEVALGIEWAQELLMESIETSEVSIDFDDQLYMPLYYDLTFPQHDWVLIDEAQDTNALRLEISRRMLRPNGRLIAVGDPAQAIYGFTGADSDSLEHISSMFGTIDLPLTVSFRCPQAVVRVAQQWNDLIEASPSAPEGEYRTVDFGPRFIGEVMNASEAQRQNSVVLCRYNAPIVGLAFRFLREGISAHVAGRDIGASVKALLKRLGGSENLSPAKSLIQPVLDFQAKEEARFLSRGQESKAANVADRCSTLLALIDGALLVNAAATVYDVELWIDRVIADDLPGLTLSSIHKAKGREWDTVYWLGRNGYQPCPWARRDWQQGQERNLMYVAATRAKRALVEVNVSDPNPRLFDPNA